MTDAMNTAPQIPGLVYVQPLGHGGYADVYLYEQQSPRMPVAVKVLKGSGITAQVTAEFLAEADTMAALGDHPYIVQVFRAGTAADGRPYLVMKYYPPPNLAQRARAERFAVSDVLRMGIQLASAVETAHQAHIVHRDIKPANVLLSAYGAPGLTDFGIAGRGVGRAGADSAAAGVRTADEGMPVREEMGVSVPWAAPEVVYGESNGDARSDVYSLAATLWQLLTGRSPFEVPGGDNTAYALMPRIRSKPVPATGRPDVPPALDRLLAQAMAKDPAHRPQSAMELARQLQSVEQDLRLPRTQILVLDDRGRATLPGVGIRPQPSAPAAPSSPGSATRGPGSAAGSAEDRTHVKGPQRVQAQRPPAPPVSPPSSPAPAPARPGVTLGPAASPAAPISPDAATDTPLRPAWDRDTEGFLDPSLPPGADTAGMPSRPTPAWVKAAVVVGVVLALLLGLVLLRPGQGGSSQTPITTLVPTSEGPAIDGVFEPPVVTAEPRTGLVHFAWTYGAPAAKDTYRVRLGGTEAEAAAAAPTVVTARSFDAPAAPGTQVCAIVAVVRAGQISPSSKVVCASGA